MASADKELEEQLLEAGNKLVDPPPSVDELLPLLDRVEGFLSRVEQSPSKSMQSALSPSMKALIADKLLRHSDVDVKVAVASCISEITRISAPDAPYDDDQMKEVFQLIVSSFKDLFDKSSQSYAKRTSILETVAKVRSCVVMLDLECDALILEMFQHFFKAIREHHPDNVFSSMETIMTLVLEESEEISLDLLSTILDSVKKDNEEVLPITRKLGERVLESCASRLKPYLVQAVKNLGISLENYSDVLASICQDASGSLEQNDACATSEHVEDESKSAEAPMEELTQGIKEEASEAAPIQPVSPPGDKSPQSVMSNGIAQAGEDESLADSKSLKKQEDGDCSDQSRANGEPDNMDIEKIENTAQKPDRVSKRRRKKSTSTKSAEPSESPADANDKETEKLPDSKSQTMDVPDTPEEDRSIEAAGPSEDENNVKVPSPKAVDDESEVIASPSPSESPVVENRSKKSGRRKDSSAKGAVVSAEDASKKASEGTSDLEAKPNRRSAKKTSAMSSDEKKPTNVDLIKKGSAATSESEAKKQLAKGSNKSHDGSSSKQPDDKKRGRGKVTSELVAEKSSAKDEDKEMVSSSKSGKKTAKDEQPSEETPKTNLKRKRTPGKDDSNSKEYGENLVGSRVKVYWPHDRMFYKGVVHSFDSSKKKHKVCYDDGDEEVLNLKREKWEFIDDDSDADGEEESGHASPEASADMNPKKQGKTSAEDSTKQGKMDASSKSGGGAMSSKAKGASTKSGHKSKDDSKSKDSKIVGKSEDEVGRKSKDTPKSGTKLKNTDTPKSSKSKDEDVTSAKPSSKSKQEALKTGKSQPETSSNASSKGKPQKSGKSKVNGTGKVKSGLSKTKDAENENSGDSEQMVEDTKGKTPNSSKAQGSEAKSGTRSGTRSEARSGTRSGTRSGAKSGKKRRRS